MPKAQYDITAQQRGTNQDQPITWKASETIGTAKLLAIDASGAPTLVNIPTSTVINVNFEKTLFVNPTAPNATDTRSGNAADKYDANYPFVTMEAAMNAAVTGDNLFIGGGDYTWTLTAAKDYSAKVVDWHFGAGTSFTVAGSYALTHNGDVYGDCGAFTVTAPAYTNEKLGGASFSADSLVANGAFTLTGGKIALRGNLSGTGEVLATKLTCANITGTSSLGLSISDVSCYDITSPTWVIDATINCHNITEVNGDTNTYPFLMINASGVIGNIDNLEGLNLVAYSVGNISDSDAMLGSVVIDSQNSIGTISAQTAISIITAKCGNTCGNISLGVDAICVVKLIGGDFGNVGNENFGAASVNYACESVGDVYAQSHSGKVDSAGNLLGIAASSIEAATVSKFSANSVTRLDTKNVSNSRIETLGTLNISDISAAPTIKLECNRITNPVAVDFTNGNQSGASIDISAKYIGGYVTAGQDNNQDAHTVVLRGAAIAAQPVLAPGCALHLYNCYIKSSQTTALGVDYSPADETSIFATVTRERSATHCTLELADASTFTAGDKVSVRLTGGTGYNSAIGTDIEDGIVTLTAADATTITYLATSGSTPEANTADVGGQVYKAVENVSVRAYQGATDKPLYSACVVGLIDSSNTIYDADMLPV